MGKRGREKETSAFKGLAPKQQQKSGSSSTSTHTSRREQDAEEEDGGDDSNSNSDSNSDSDDDSDDNAALEAGAEEEEESVADPLHLPRMLVAFAEDVLQQTERDVVLDAGDAWQQAHKALDKAHLLLVHHHPQLQTLLDDAAARRVSAGDTRVPPGSKDVQRSRRDMRYLMCMLYTARARLLAAVALDPSAQSVRAALQAALVFFPRCTQALLLLAQAERALCSTPEQLAAVESLLRKAVTAALAPVAGPKGAVGDSDSPAAPLDPADVENEKAAQVTCRKLLALLLCQDGRFQEACKFLRALGHSYRLSRQILAYALPPPGAAATVRADSLVQVFDRALPRSIVLHLNRVFHPSALFWKEHNYDLASNSARDVGYVSYQFPLSPAPSGCCMPAAQEAPRNSVEAIVLELYRQCCSAFPAVLQATVAEWWVHSRAHSSGHQLHYDSDETVTEAGGAARHPLCSVVLYLTEDEDEGAPTGGPTLVTDQRLGGPLGSHGYLCYPKCNRLCMFDAKHLHGVLPGRGAAAGAGRRRLTFMAGFWTAIGARDRGAGCPGPAQPLPPMHSKHSTWQRDMQLTAEEAIDLADASSGTGGSCAARQRVGVVPVAAVWEPIDAQGSGGSLKLSGVTMPTYQACFQGF